MTRRSGRARVTEREDPVDGREPDRFPSLRERNPVAFWIAIVGTFAMVLSTFAAALSAFL